MRILLIGFLALCAWSALATYLYVCKIKELCDEPLTAQIAEVKQSNVRVADTTHKPVVQEQAVIPESLVTYFAFDKSDFNSNEETDKYFVESNKYLNQNAQTKLNIAGHTDAIGSDEYNQALGFRRAQSLQHYFESKGILSNKIIIESKGEKEPVADNNTSSGRAKNRRTVITIKN
jgi:OOP family OmpA-OmpF porin